jgi:hypothetical protein
MLQRRIIRTPVIAPSQGVPPDIVGGYRCLYAAAATATRSTARCCRAINGAVSKSIRSTAVRLWQLRDRVLPSDADSRAE